MKITDIQVQHLKRNLIQRLRVPQLGVLGGYHGGNLGDMALGLSISTFSDKMNIRNGLQTIYNLDKWPKSPYAIIGGGAVGYLDSLYKVYNRYKGNFSKIGFLGVDFNEANYPDDIRQMLTEAAFVSCRSEKQANRINKIANRSITKHHPDIAFSLLREFCTASRAERKNKQKKLFVNVLPLYADFVNGQLVPMKNYKNERPELYENFSIMQQSYAKAVRTQVKQALSDGFTVESAPFTPEDNYYCKFILEGLPVDYPNYHADPLKMLKHFTTGERIISTRFHATIFGLKAGLTIQPVAYATKNELLLNDLGFTPKMYLNATDLANGKIELPAGIKVENDLVADLEIKSEKAIASSFDTLSIR